MNGIPFFIYDRLITKINYDSIIAKKVYELFFAKKYKNSNKFKASFITIKVKKIIEMKGKKTIHLQISIFLTI